MNQLDRLMESINKFIEYQAELDFFLALKESETVAELKKKKRDIESCNSLIEEDIQIEINDKYYKKIRNHIENMKVN